MTGRCSFALFLALALAAGSVRAQDAGKNGRQRYEDCLAYTRVEEYAEAAAACKDAYVLSRDPAALYTLGQIYRQSGDPADSIHYFELFVAEKDGSLSPRGREDMQKLIAEEQTALTAKAAASVPASRPAAPSSALPAGRSAASAPVRAPALRKALAAPPSPVTRTQPSPGALAAAPVSRSPARHVAGHWYQDRIGDGLAGGGVLCAAAGAVLVDMAEEGARAAAGAKTLGSWHGAADPITAERISGVALTISGAGLLVAGAISYWSWSGREGVTVVAATPQGIAFSIAGRF